jgi:AmmeMemoRadiSam system protein B
MVKKHTLIIIIALPALVILAGGVYFLKPKSDAISKNALIKIADVKNKNLSSFFKNKEDYESAFAKAVDIVPEKVLAGIVSHHFLAKDLIARFFAGMQSDGIENIIVVGPDHYGALQGEKTDAVTAAVSWDTPYGEIKANEGLEEKIIKGYNATNDDSVFRREHSIYAEVPFIKKIFPQARLIPLVLKNTGDYEKFIKLGQGLRELMPEKTVLIVSSDFSHEADVFEAKNNDIQSIAALQNLSPENMNKINCDCRACMAVLLGFLGQNSKNNFSLLENKNSQDFGSPDEKVTSYVSGYFLNK